MESLMAIAKEQTVVGLIGEALMRNGFRLQKKDALDVYASLEKIREENEGVNLELSRFARALEKRDVKYVVVKGQTIGALYQNPVARMTGDVDLYVVGEDFQRVREFVEERLRCTLELTDEKHLEFEAHDVLFELHQVLSKFSNKNTEKRFQQLIDKVVTERPCRVLINGVWVRTLPPTYNVLYTFLHLFGHLIESGVGLRQFCDLARLIHVVMQGGDEQETSVRERLNDGAERLNVTELEKSLCEFGMMKAFCAMGAFLVEVLGLPEKEFPFPLKNKDKKWVRVIKKNVMEGGNFGRARRKVEQTGVIHSIETGWYALKQQLLFFKLAPKEVGLRYPRLIAWFVRKNLHIG